MSTTSDTKSPRLVHRLSPAGNSCSKAPGPRTYHPRSAPLRLCGFASNTWAAVAQSGRAIYSRLLCTSSRRTGTLGPGPDERRKRRTFLLQVLFSRLIVSYGQLPKSSTYSTDRRDRLQLLECCMLRRAWYRIEVPHERFPGRRSTSSLPTGSVSAHAWASQRAYECRRDGVVCAVVHQYSFPFIRQ